MGELEATVHKLTRNKVFDIKNDGTLVLVFLEIKVLELVVTHACDDGGIVLVGVNGGNELFAILVLNDSGISPWIIDVHLAAELLQFGSDIDNLGIAAVGAVFFEGNTQHEDIGILDLMVVLNHQLQRFVGNEVGD